MFSSFYGDENKLSNTIELWDAIPKYSCSARMQAQLRDTDGRLPTYVREFTYKPQGSTRAIPARMELMPARVMMDGLEHDVLPSANEELIEEVARKFFADQNFGWHFEKSGESFVDFSLYMIAKELRARGHSRSLEQIKRSLDIMNGCRLTVRFEGGDSKAAYKGAIFPEIAEVSRSEYIADPKGRWRVRLPFAYSGAVNRLEFRQFNYATLMAMSTPLARWLHKLLSQRYTNAALTTPYSILYSTIKSNSGLLNHSRETRNKTTVIGALDELKEQDVLMWYDIGKSENNARDPKYTLTPTSDFVGEMKAANRRQADHIKALPSAGVRKIR